VIGQMSGTENVTLLTQQLPSHNHALMATTAAATTGAVGVTVVPATVSGDTMYVTDIAGATGAALALNTVSGAGNTQPHDNLMPTLTVQYCIAWAGIFPSQS
jgi:microcystin-dependent protein